MSEEAMETVVREEGAMPQAPSDPGFPGADLRAARERLGLSIAEVSGQTKLSPRQIEAIEADDYASLPEMAFVRGFVRSYAKVLQLDVEGLLARLPKSDRSHAQVVPESVDVPFPTGPSVQRQNLILLGVALFLSVLVVAFAVWHFTSPSANETVPAVEKAVEEAAVALPTPEAVSTPVAESVPQASAAVEAGPPAATEPATTTPVSAEPTKPALTRETAVLRLNFDEKSWVEVREPGDVMLFSKTSEAGEEVLLDGKLPLTVVIGHAAGVRVYFKGKKVDLAPSISAASDVARLELK